MANIFHERQDGSLCAVHCLNALLQGPYFTPVDLGIIARELDEAENELQSGLVVQSYNMDDSGFFSIQVLSKALAVWGIEMLPFTSSEVRATEAVANPADMQAYICHFRDHWYTIRKINGEWYNLNSFLPGPERISVTYLSLNLAQLRDDGYSIFIIFGDLPQRVVNFPILGHSNAKRKKIVPVKKSKPALEENGETVDKELQLAVELSMTCHENIQATPVNQNESEVNTGQADLESSASTQKQPSSENPGSSLAHPSTSAPTQQLTIQEIRLKRLEAIKRNSKK